MSAKGLDRGMGERLVWLRQATGMSQQEVADAVGISRTGLSAIEVGDRLDIRLSTFQALADFYGVAPAYLTGGGERPDKNLVRAAALRASEQRRSA